MVHKAKKLNMYYLRSFICMLLAVSMVLSVFVIDGSHLIAAYAVKTVSAVIYQDATYQQLSEDDEAAIVVSGNIPDGAAVKAYPVKDTGMSGTVYAAYDITVFDADGREWQPEGTALNVSITTSAITAAAKDGRDFDVYHIPDNGQAEMVESKVISEGVSFSAESFSVYIIKDHEDGEVKDPARIEFHFIGDMASTQGFGDPENNTYKSPEYYFANQNNEWQSTMILADGETIEKIESPPNHGDEEFFYGWYVVYADGQTPHETVEYQGKSYDCIVYHWEDDPVEVRYGDRISIQMNDARNAVTWKINGVTAQENIPLTDNNGCCAHVYLAPLYSDYRFVNFFSEPQDEGTSVSIADETLLTRKLIALGANKMSDVLLSDTTAPSPDARHKVFVGWESDTRSLLFKTKFYVYNSDLELETGVYRPTQGQIPELAAQRSDGYYLRCYDPQDDVNLYPLFSQARWFTFDTNSNKEASYVSSVNMLTSDSVENPEGTRETKFEISRRNGYSFNGWTVDTTAYSVVSYDRSTHSVTPLSAYQVTDAQGNILAPADGTTIRVCKKNDTAVVYYEIYNDSGTGRLIAYDAIPIGTEQENYIDGVSLKASWVSQATTRYSVVIWKQMSSDEANLPDTQKHYDFVEYYSDKEGATGATVSDLMPALTSYTRHAENGEEAYNGFELGRVEISSRDDSNVLHADGTSVVNIYYDRKVHSLSFYPSSGNTLIQRITALYGHNISEYFPIKGQDGIQYNHGERWMPQNSSTFKQVLVYIDTMPDDTINFRLNTSSASEKTATYYVETLEGAAYDKLYDGRKYAIYHTTKAKYNFFTYDEDFIILEGFDRQIAVNTANYSEQLTNSHEIHGNIDCFYTRRNYELIYNCNYGSIRSADVTYSSGKSQNKTVAGIPYQTPMSQVESFVPNAPDLYYFAGWYADPAGVTKVELSEITMPASNKTVYAKWEPIRLLVKYELNGGVFTDASYQNDIYNYYPALANEPIVKPEPPERKYIVISGTEAQSRKEQGLPVYRYLNYHYIDFEGGIDNTNLPVNFRKAQYFENTQENINALFEEYVQQYPESMRETIRSSMKDVWMTSAFYGTEEQYKPVPSDAEIRYEFMEWYQVDEDTGLVSDIPYDFTKPLTKSITLRAEWRLKGGYRITYIPEYIDEYNNFINGLSDTITSWNDPQIDKVDSSYADHGVTSIFRQPSIITKNGVVTDDYTFEGWRLVRRVPVGNNRFKYVPLYPEADYYEPGEKFIVSSIYSLEGNNTIYMQAVYAPRTETFRRPEVVTMNLDANGGYLLNSQKQPLTEDEAAEWEKPGTAVKKYKASTGYDQLVFKTFQTNKAIHLVKYAVDSQLYQAPQGITPDNVFDHSSGYFLLGFDDAPDENDYAARYVADSVITMNRKSRESTIYAVWEPMVYLDLVNKTHSDVTISLSAEESRKLYVVNERVTLFDRVKVSDPGSITIPHADALTGEDGILHIALPCGMMYAPDSPITITGTNEIGSGYMMKVTSNNPHRTTGDVSSVPELVGYHGSYELKDTLFTSQTPKEALTVTFEEQESEYTVILDDNYIGGTTHELYCTHTQVTDPTAELQFIDPNTRLANEFWGWAYSADATVADFSVHDVSNYKITDLQAFFQDHHIVGNDNVVHLYAVWHPNLNANQVRVYKEVVGGASDKGFTFQISFNGSYTYKKTNSFYSSTGTASGTAAYQIKPDEYLQLDVTKFDGKANSSEVSWLTLTKNHPMINIRVQKFKVSDVRATTPLEFSPGVTYQMITWEKTISNGVTFANSAITFTVTEINGTEQYAPKLEHYTTEITVEGYSEHDNSQKPEPDNQQRKVTWHQSDTAAWILYTNNRLLHDVTVTKTVTDPAGIAPTKEFHFGAALADTQEVMDYSYRIPDRDKEFTLTDGESFVIKDVPVGAKLQITEADDNNSYETTATASGSITDFEQTGRRCSFTVVNAENDINFENKLKSVHLRIRNIGEEGNPMTGTVFRMTGKVPVFERAIPVTNGYLQIPGSSSNSYQVYYDNSYSIAQLISQSGYENLPDIHVTVKYTGEDGIEVVITNPDGQKVAKVSRDPDAAGDMHSYVITITSPIRYIAPTNHSSTSAPYAVMLLMIIPAVLLIRRKKTEPVYDEESTGVKWI